MILERLHWFVSLVWRQHPWSLPDDRLERLTVREAWSIAKVLAEAP